MRFSTLASRLYPVVLVAAAAALGMPSPTSGQTSRTGEGRIPGEIEQEAMRERLESALSRDPGDVDAWLTLTQLELLRGDTLRAETLLRSGVRDAAASPRVGELRRGLLEILSAQAQWSAADSVVDAMGLPAADASMAEVNALGARVRFNAGVQARVAGDLDRALRLWSGATEIDPGLREGWREVARMHLLLGDTASARTTLGTARGHHPDDPELRLLEATTLDGEARAEAEKTALRDLRASRPDDEAVGLALAARLAASMELDAAIALHDTLLAQPAPSAVTYAQVGRFWLRYDRGDSAISVLDRGEQRHPDDVTLAVLLGAAAERLDPAAYVRSGDAYLRAGALLADQPGAAVDDVWLRIRAADAYADAGEVERVRTALGPLASRPLATDAALSAAEIAGAMGLAGLARGLVEGEAEEGAGAALDLLRREAAVELAAGPEVDDRWRELAVEGSVRAALELGSEATREEAAAGLRGGLVRIGELERRVVSSAERGMVQDVDPVAIARGDDLRTAFAARRAEIERERVEELLEGVVFDTDWGASELERLRALYPLSPLLGRTAVRAALRRWDASVALEEVERLVDRFPGEASVHALDGRTRAALGDAAGALAAWIRALELDAGCDGAYEALVRSYTEEGRLEDLLPRLRRLRVIDAEEPRRWAHEVETLHRLGRLDEAAALAEAARSLGRGATDGGCA
jgi:predicted Zn-dependent protease